MKELFKNTWSENDRGVRIFLLAGDESALVIDSGRGGFEDVKSLVSDHTDLPFKLLNTHVDRDHIGGNGQFEEIYMHPSEMAFYHNEQHGKGKLIPVFEGDLIDLGGRELEIIHLPGHTPGSITVLDRQSRSLFGGDPVQKNGDIFMFGAQRDLCAYVASLEKLCKRDDFDYIYPSHSEEKVGREVIPQLIEGAKKILSGELRSEKRDMFGRTIDCFDAGVSRFLCMID